MPCRASCWAARCRHRSCGGACRVRQRQPDTVWALHAGRVCEPAALRCRLDSRGFRMDATQDRLNQLFTFTVDFAKDMLAENGDFFPFGAVVSDAGTVSAEAGQDSG